MLVGWSADLFCTDNLSLPVPPRWRWGCPVPREWSSSQKLHGTNTPQVSGTLKGSFATRSAKPGSWSLYTRKVENLREHTEEIQPHLLLGLITTPKVICFHSHGTHILPPCCMTVFWVNNLKHLCQIRNPQYKSDVKCHLFVTLCAMYSGFTHPTKKSFGFQEGERLGWALLVFALQWRSGT